MRELQFQLDDWSYKDQIGRQELRLGHGATVYTEADKAIRDDWAYKVTEIGPTKRLHGFWYVVSNRKGFKQLYSNVCLG